MYLMHRDSIVCLFVSNKTIKCYVTLYSSYTIRLCYRKHIIIVFIQCSIIQHTISI
ncbi:hypothetical protein Paride_0140 [Pseudomonas phage Paride]|nr:hypothetical protein Paride_0140 [Pseudomonas phage Paride]